MENSEENIHANIGLKRYSQQRQRPKSFNNLLLRIN